MTLKKTLEHARQRLSGHWSVEDPRLESEVLIRHILEISRAQLYLDLNIEVSPSDEARLKQQIERRMKGEPLAYIINSREFYGLDFFVDRRVLIPRPETELLVEEAIRLCTGRPNALLADIGTGSGAITVSLAVNLPKVKIQAVDISPQALEVARLNLDRHEVKDRVTLLQGDLLEPLNIPVDGIIANLPYVRTGDWEKMPSAAFEPREALDGGEKGLDQLFRLIDQLQGKIKKDGWVLMEIGLGQARDLTSRLKKLYPQRSIAILQDLAGIDRVISLS